MNKTFLSIMGVLVFFLLGLAPVTKKEDVLEQARKIKASQVTDESSSLTEEFVLTVPERLHYNARFLGIKIGQFIIINNGKTLLNGREAYQVELLVKTLPFFGKTFKAKDRYLSYMDAQTYKVLRHEEYTKDGTFLESVVDFDYVTHTATYKNFVDLSEKKTEIPDQVFDILCGGYYLRMKPIALGDTVDIKIYADAKIYDYAGLFPSKTTFNVPYQGKQEAYFFKPYLFHNGEQNKKISADVYFSTTTPPKPLRAVLKSRFGSVYVILVEKKDRENKENR